MVLHKNRKIDQWNRIERPEINPHLHGQLILHKRAKNTPGRKDTFFNKWCWDNWVFTCKRMNLDPYLTPPTNINSKQITDSTARLEFNHETPKRKQE